MPSAFQKHLTAQNKLTRSVNYAGGRGKITVTYNAKEKDSPVEVMLCENIGKDAWTGEGFTLANLRDALNGVPTSRELQFFTNSQGGYVDEGCSIRNWLSGWDGNITNTILGLAASAASWCIPADSTKAYKNSQIFVHRAMAAPFGNVDDMAEAIDQLNKTDGQIADMYAEKTSKTREEMLDMMRGKNGQGALFTAQEAKELGLIDEIIDDEIDNNNSPEWINSAREKLTTYNLILKNSGTTPGNKQQTNKTIMDKTKMIARLNKLGVTVPENATDEQLLDLVEAGLKTQTAPPVNALSAEDKTLLDGLRNQVAENRKREIRNALIAIASADGGQRIPVNEIDAWEVQAVAAKDGTDGNPILNSLRKLPAQAPGFTPLNDGAVIEVTGQSFGDVQKFIVSNSSGFARQFLGNKAQNEVDSRVLKEIGNRSMAVANCIKQNKAMLIEKFNSNTIDADLQRQLILQDMLEAYALNLLPLEAFSVVYQNVPLQGNDAVVVPYFPLQATGSTQFVKGTGYTTKSDWVQNSRKVTIGGDGDAASNGANATAGTAKDRLFQAIDFTSYDMRRQPYLNVMKLAQQAANKLGVDVASQIYSRVIVVGNFGAAVKTVAAALFSADDIADLCEICDTAEWPAIARSLVLTNTYKTPLLKDNAFKQYLSYGSTDPIRKAQIQEAYGFQDMYFVPNLAGKLAANTAGFVTHKSAVLCAFAPIMPSPEVRNLLTAYDIAIEPRSGAVLEYRKFGNATTDTTTEVIECSFGAAKGVDAALKIVKSA